MRDLRRSIFRRLPSGGPGDFPPRPGIPRRHGVLRPGGALFQHAALGPVMDPGTSRPMLIGLILVLSASSLPGAQEPAAAPSTLPQSQPATQESRPRSLLLYLEDGLGAAEVPAYGYPQMTTPNLVLLMEEGVTYLSEYSVSPWTIPATASLLTSLYPSAHGAQKAGDRLPASARTLTEVLKEN